MVQCVPAPWNKTKQKLKLISPMQLHPCAQQPYCPHSCFPLHYSRLLYLHSSLYCFEVNVLATTCEQEHAIFDFLCLKNVPSMSLQQQNLIFIGKSYSSMHICWCARSSVSGQYKRFFIVVLVNSCKCLLCVTCKTSAQFSSFGYVPGIKILGSGGSSLLGFSSKTVQFPCGCINSHSHHLCMKGFSFKKKNRVYVQGMREGVCTTVHMWRSEDDSQGLPCGLLPRLNTVCLQGRGRKAPPLTEPSRLP